MRDIKFRAWDIELKKMWWNVQNAYDTLSHHCCETKECSKDDTDLKNDLSHSSFGDILKDHGMCVMQFTGLKDKNGKDIYEGDIIKKYDIVGKLEGVFEVYWREDRWHLQDKDGEGYDNGDYYNGDDITWEPHTTVMGLSKDGVEIIGNIYENPELLDAPTANPT